jgi:hypothetical protein
MWERRKTLLFVFLTALVLCGVVSAASTVAWAGTASVNGTALSYTWNTGGVGVNASLSIVSPVSVEFYNATNLPASGSGSKTLVGVGTWSIYLSNNTYQSLATDTVAVTEHTWSPFYGIQVLIEDMITILGSVVELVIAALPAIVVVSLVLFLMGVLALIEQKM